MSADLFTLFKGMIGGFLVIMILILIDFIFAVAIRLKYNKFDWSKFLNYLKSGLTPYVLIWFVLSAIGIGVPWIIENMKIADIGLETIIPVGSIVGIVWVTILAKAVNSIKEKAVELDIEIKNAKKIVDN